MKLKSLQILKKPKFFGLLSTLIAGLVIIPFIAFPAFSATQKANIQFVSPAWVAQNSKNANLRILDVRNVPLDYITTRRTTSTVLE